MSDKTNRTAKTGAVVSSVAAKTSKTRRTNLSTTTDGLYSKFNKIIEVMKERPVALNIKNTTLQLKSLDTNSMEMQKKTLQGHAELRQVRNKIQNEYIGKTKDTERINICMLNEYLNKYSEKLCRPKKKDEDNIKLDNHQFMTLTKGVDKQTTNPYHFFQSDKMIADKMNREIVENENPRFMKRERREEIKQIDEAMVKKEMTKCLRKAAGSLKNNKHNYMKAADINKFENFS
jgi:hypothetical protein